MYEIKSALQGLIQLELRTRTVPIFGVNLFLEASLMHMLDIFVGKSLLLEMVLKTNMAGKQAVYRWIWTFPGSKNSLDLDCFIWTFEVQDLRQDTAGRALL